MAKVSVTISAMLDNIYDNQYDIFFQVSDSGNFFYILLTQLILLFYILLQVSLFCRRSFCGKKPSFFFKEAWIDVNLVEECVLVLYCFVVAHSTSNQLPILFRVPLLLPHFLKKILNVRLGLSAWRIIVPRHTVKSINITSYDIKCFQSYLFLFYHCSLFPITSNTINSSIFNTNFL